MKFLNCPVFFFLLVRLTSTEFHQFLSKRSFDWVSPKLPNVPSLNFVGTWFCFIAWFNLRSSDNIDLLGVRLFRVFCDPSLTSVYYPKESRKKTRLSRSWDTKGHLWYITEGEMVIVICFPRKWTQRNTISVTTSSSGMMVGLITNNKTVEDASR